MLLRLPLKFSVTGSLVSELVLDCNTFRRGIAVTPLAHNSEPILALSPPRLCFGFLACVAVSCAVIAFSTLAHVGLLPSILTWFPGVDLLLCSESTALRHCAHSYGSRCARMTCSDVRNAIELIQDLDSQRSGIALVNTVR